MSENKNKITRSLRRS